MGLRLLPEAVRWNFNLGLRGAKCAVSVPDLGGGAERRRGGENGVFPVCLGRHGPPELEIYRYLTGIYHFFGSFPEWYGISKSGMVSLVFGSSAPGTGRFLSGAGESTA